MFFLANQKLLETLKSLQKILTPLIKKLEAGELSENEAVGQLEHWLETCMNKQDKSEPLN